MRSISCCMKILKQIQHTNRSTFPFPLYSATFNLLWYSCTRSTIFWYVSFCRAFVGVLPVSISFPESIAFAQLPFPVLCNISTFSHLASGISYMLTIRNHINSNRFLNCRYSYQIWGIRWHNVDWAHFVYQWKLLQKIYICSKLKYFDINSSLIPFGAIELLN